MTDTDLSNRSPEQIQSEIAATRHSLDRKLDELQHRLNPRERMDAIRTRANDAVESARERAADVVNDARERAGDVLNSARGRAGAVLNGARVKLADTGEKLHPRNFEPYMGWVAVGAVVSGTMMAINAWRRAQCRSVDDASGFAMTSDVTIVNTSDLGDLPPAP